MNDLKKRAHPTLKKQSRKFAKLLKEKGYKFSHVTLHRLAAKHVRNGLTDKFLQAFGAKLVGTTGSCGCGECSDFASVYRMEGVTFYTWAGCFYDL